MNDYKAIDGQGIYQPPTATQLAQMHESKRQQMQDIANRQQSALLASMVNPGLQQSQLGAQMNGLMQSQYQLHQDQAKAQMLQAQLAQYGQGMMNQAAAQVLKPLPALEILELSPEQLDAITGAT